MIHSYTLNIKEIDDAEFALEELEEQLSAITLRKILRQRLIVSNLRG